jgi:dihydrofolate reductase
LTERIAQFCIEGHAIISDNDCIADADGIMPPSLRNAADWAYFQRHLDHAAVVITGRKGHEAHPNKPGRQRLVFTGRVGQAGLQRDGNITFCDPARFDFFEAVQELSPAGGILAVTGGTAVFDWFLRRRLYTAFHLGRARGVQISNGRPLFCDPAPAETVLSQASLRLVEEHQLDAANNVAMKVFIREEPKAISS